MSIVDISMVTVDTTHASAEKPTLVQTLCDALVSEKYTLHLTPHEMAFTKTLLRDHPELFENIHDTIQDIVSDGQLNLHDIPKLVLLVSQIYHAHMMTTVVRQVGVINLVKFTLDAILASGLVPLPAIEITLIQRIMDTSLDLLNTNLTHKTGPSLCSQFWGWMRRMMRCCSRCHRCGSCSPCSTCPPCPKAKQN